MQIKNYLGKPLEGRSARPPPPCVSEWVKQMFQRKNRLEGGGGSRLLPPPVIFNLSSRNFLRG